MAVKAVEMVRKIRDRHYEETKDFSTEEQIRFIKEKSMQLQKGLGQGMQYVTADNMAQKSV
jgi:hypothetical protein